MWVLRAVRIAVFERKGERVCSIKIKTAAHGCAGGTLLGPGLWCWHAELGEKGELVLRERADFRVFTPLFRVMGLR